MTLHNHNNSESTQTTPIAPSEPDTTRGAPIESEEARSRTTRSIDDNKRRKYSGGLDSLGGGRLP